MGKIREVDALLKEDKKVSDIFIESQPEVCFTALNNDEPLEYYKKEKKGIRERLRLLRSHWKFEKNPYQYGKNAYTRKRVAVDDILDAWVLGISAAFGRESLKYFPENYEHDEEGLPMRMGLPDFNE
jgi:predicted RNase H-like nuclease